MTLWNDPALLCRVAPGVAGLEHPVRKKLVFAVIAALLVIANVAVVRAAGTPNPNDMARVLAGLAPAANSPLAVAAGTPGWRLHATTMDAAWASFEKRLVTRIRVWSAVTLTTPRPVMFYMFGGPDFIHADAFFPDASVYVLSGLEPIGPLPDVAHLPEGVLAASLGALRQSLGNFLRYGYFITREMGTQLKTRKLSGVLPVLYVFLARSGKTINQVRFVALNARGEVAPARGKRKPSGVRISFTGPDGRPRTLYYFRTDLSNAGVKKSAFLKFCMKLGQGDALIKSASYLLHLGNFSKVRDFILDRSATILQDDSGIPVKYFTTGLWRLRLFGQYSGPIEEFKRFYQRELADLFRTGGAQGVNFGIGYNWHPRRTNILVANRLAAPGVRP
ncbi:hypothetical protein BMS3Bbin10_02408 [bacterium BMS3Bbin10]|nr:hypothetical protein BMS3Bbin10_02408 [bacterium BMS3Bbin10]